MASAVSPVLDSQEAYLPVCYDQWWTSCVAGSTAGHTYYSSWKEAIAISFVHRKLARERGRWWWPANNAITLEQSVFSESHTTKIIKNPINLWFCRKRLTETDTDTHTHTERTITVTPRHMRRELMRARNVHLNSLLPRPYPSITALEGWGQSVIIILWPL